MQVAFRFWLQRKRFRLQLRMEILLHLVSSFEGRIPNPYSNFKICNSQFAKSKEHSETHTRKSGINTFILRVICRVWVLCLLFPMFYRFCTRDVKSSKFPQRNDGIWYLREPGKIKLVLTLHLNVNDLVHNPRCSHTWAHTAQNFLINIAE